MNMTTDKTFDMALPQAARELVSKTTKPAGIHKVAPRSKIVFYSP
jgi:hypothetical protein